MVIVGLGTEYRWKQIIVGYEYKPVCGYSKYCFYDAPLGEIEGEQDHLASEDLQATQEPLASEDAQPLHDAPAMKDALSPDETKDATVSTCYSYCEHRWDGCYCCRCTWVPIYEWVLEQVPYWITMNSWGTGWGESGFMRIERVDNTVGICAAHRYVFWVETRNLWNFGYCP